METYFGIRYEFDKSQVHTAIDIRLKEPGADYVCVADGNILALVHQDEEYRQIVNGGMFSICDSGYVPLYLRFLYQIKKEQYCGSEIFKDIVSSQKFKMVFLGTNQYVLDNLKAELCSFNPTVSTMGFYELPFCDVENFNYNEIANLIEEESPDIIWVALGAPKQERFMFYLKPLLKRGVMIAVGAVFQFYAKCGIKRAPMWMVNCKMEWIYRIYAEPRKQIKRVLNLIPAVFGAIRDEFRNRRNPIV